MPVFSAIHVSLKNKIITSFFISFLIIVILSIVVYINFVEIKKELYFLEFTASLRANSLQLRRHEKNFLLFADKKEIQSVYNYLNRIQKLIKEHSYHDKLTNNLNKLNLFIEEYKENFERMTNITKDFSKLIMKLKSQYNNHLLLLSLVESTHLDHPLASIQLLKKTNISSDEHLIPILNQLEKETHLLRKHGESITLLSRNIDRDARNRVEEIIKNSQQTVFILVPISFIIGLSLILAITTNVIKRLRLLMVAIIKIGKGEFSSIPIPTQQDEVSTLIEKFNQMEKDLKFRQVQLKIKDEELVQSKKLASLGTLASGIAHELNNPLNNIYLAVQTLSREIRDVELSNLSEIIIDSIGDIHSQTLRAKNIVSEFLEFSRDKKSNPICIEVSELLDQIFQHSLSTYDLSNIDFKINGKGNIYANKKQMEQVFVNLLSNAVEAVQYNGKIEVYIEKSGLNKTQITVTDSGYGLTQAELERIFDPFFTKKEKGTGLGLFIVYRIIKQHQGTIHVKSVLNSGTSFIINLPESKINHEI